MNTSETLKAELKTLCTRMAKILGIKQGSAEVHYHEGKVTRVHIHDKSIKFEDNNTTE